VISLAHGARYRVVFRRRREGKTDYRKRKAMILSGVPRLVVRPSLKHIIVQIVKAEPEGDKTSVFVRSSELRRFGWEAPCGNVPSAYLTGLLAGLKAVSGGIKKAILDIGLHRASPGSRVFAALKGALDAGVEIPHDERVLPERSRIMGEHIASYGRRLSEERPDLYKKLFSKYLERGIEPKDLTDHFTKVKEKMITSFEESGKLNG